MRRAANGSRPALDRRRPPRALVRLVNPVVRRLVARGVAGEHLLLLHYRGRRTGRAYDVPVGFHLLDGVPHVLTDSPWRHNFAAPADLEVTLRGRRRRARGVLRDDPDEVATAYAGLVERLGVRGAERRLGLRVDLDRAPTRGELVELVRRTGLSMVRIDLVGPG